MRTNVYYLAPPAPPTVSASRMPAGLALRLRLFGFWCRLRLTAAELVDVLRRFGHGEGSTEALILERRADLVLAVAPRPGPPARIIDFVAARARLRP